jgi:hypothetical protein
MSTPLSETSKTIEEKRMKAESIVLALRPWMDSMKTPNDIVSNHCMQQMVYLHDSKDG